MRRIAMIALMLMVAATCSTTAADDQPTQYAFEQIKVPAASAEEPLRKELSIDLAVKHLDDGAAAWSGSRQCITCHTNGTYLTVRPLLNAYIGQPADDQRKFAVDYLRKKQAEPVESLRKSTNPAQVIYLAAGLAEWDAQSTGTLSTEADEALRLVFQLQQDDATWGSLTCWPPYESDAFHLANIAMTAVAAAPGWEAGLKDAGLKAQVGKLRTYLRDTAPPHEYARVLLLLTATRTSDLLGEEQRGKLVELLRSRQQTDGGWSLRTFATPEQWGSGNRAAKLRGEPDFAKPASDGHMTGLAIVALRSAGVAKDDPQVQRGIAWLKANQRASGRWWTRSLNTDTHHFITYSGTALPVLALAMCDEVERKVGKSD